MRQNYFKEEIKQKTFIQLTQVKKHCFLLLEYNKYKGSPKRFFTTKVATYCCVTSIEYLSSKYNLVAQSYLPVMLMHGLLFMLMRFHCLYYHNYQLKSRC